LHNKTYLDIILENQFDVVLVSGRSPQQVQLQALSYDGQAVLGCMETMFKDRLCRGKPSGVSSYPNGVWHRVRHSAVGGATEYMTLMYVQGINVDPQVTVFRRTLRHFVDFGICPTKLASTNSVSTHDTSSFYNLGDRLIPNQYLRPVICHSVCSLKWMGVANFVSCRLSRILY
jgi:hypothetical protein